MTAISMAESTPFPGNPLDLVEEIVVANDWAHERLSEEELTVEISGRWHDYRIEFLWQEEIGLMHFSCGFDITVPKRRRGATFELLALVNEKLWLGHFDLSGEGGAPCYRHAMLLRGVPGLSVEQIEDLVDVALSECERFYPAFHLVALGGKAPDHGMAAAMLDPVAEA